MSVVRKETDACVARVGAGEPPPIAQQSWVGIRRIVGAALAAGLVFGACSSDTGLDGGGVDSSIEPGIPVEEVPVDEAPAEDAPAEDAPAAEE